MAFLTDTTTTQNAFGAKLAQIWADIKAASAKRALYRETIRELNTLSNRELADLGIARCEIPRIAYETSYKA